MPKKPSVHCHEVIRITLINPHTRMCIGSITIIHYIPPFLERGTLCRYKNMSNQETSEIDRGTDINYIHFYFTIM